MITLSAAVLEKLGAPLSICNDVAAGPLNRGQVLVRLAYSGVCHSQLMEVRGARGEDRFLPHLLGHEGTGRVEAIEQSASGEHLRDVLSPFYPRHEYRPIFERF